ALAMLEERDPKNPEVGNVIAHMAELCTRWDAKHPDLEGLVARGLAIVNGQRSRQKVLLLAAKSFLARKRPKPTDADWEEALATAGRDLALETEKPRLGAVSLQMETLGRLLAGDFAGVLASAARREQFLPTGKVHATLALAAAAAAAMGMPEEKSFREQLIDGEANPTDIATCDFVSAYYGMRESESSYHAIRSAGYPKGLVDQALFGPLGVLAAARWRIEDQPFVERIEAVVERTGH